MRNNFFDWLQRMGLGGYILKFTTEERNAQMTVLQHDLIRDYQTYRFIIRRRDVGAVYITAACGCVYLIERDEDYVNRCCDAHFMLSILDEARLSVIVNPRPSPSMFDPANPGTLSAIID